ncbi:hypothetical protein ASZ78_016625 [Callipepla squamata]|uniref:Cyclin-dependent kinase inhibitor domain-containing protein n=1 Tax=Callipepla squamata TaxID=9009 RepID=A0A226NDB6_CALSU|nr:hypothetical protein ASZ78_016625 [Callipepla squamata]
MNSTGNTASQCTNLGGSKDMENVTNKRQEDRQHTHGLLFATGPYITPLSFPTPDKLESLLSTFAREQHPGEKMEWQLGKIVHTQRNFFGPVDRKQLHWGFQHMLRSNIKVAQKKWNFDFLQDVPIEGFLQ